MIGTEIVECDRDANLGSSVAGKKAGIAVLLHLREKPVGNFAGLDTGIVQRDAFFHASERKAVEDDGSTRQDLSVQGIALP